MLGQFEEKGKIYTNVIHKTPKDVIIQTHTQRIQGKVYIREGERLKDQVDQAERYLAVTDAKIFGLDGVLLFSIGFIAVNHANIEWIGPLEEMVYPEESSHD